jgi:hypothetical protein
VYREAVSNRPLLPARDKARMLNQEEEEVGYSCDEEEVEQLLGGVADYSAPWEQSELGKCSFTNRFWSHHKFKQKISGILYSVQYIIPSTWIK